jgi:hypothetical protein
MDKIFTKEEIGKIKKIVNHILSPINGDFKINDCLCDVELEKNIKAKICFYEITFTSAGIGNVNFLINYPNIPDIPIINYAWGMAAQIYFHLENSLEEKVRNDLEERLWPIKNNYGPDYSKLEDI